MVTTNNISNNITFMNSQREMISQLKGQTPIEDRTWYITDPKAHYLSIAQAEEYLALQSNKKYATGMHAQEIELLQEYSPSIIGDLPESFVYIDFGPGSGDKSKILLEEAKKQNKQVSYHAIDISETILNHALSEISKLNIPVKGYVGDFIEDFNLVRDIIGTDELFIYLSATFGNYNLKSNVLCKIGERFREGNRLYVSAQNQQEDMTSILKQYESISDSPIHSQSFKQLGFMDKDLEFGTRFNKETQCIEAFVKVNNTSQLLERLIPQYILPGDIIVHSISLKPTQSHFDGVIDHFFNSYSCYYTDKFTAAVLREVKDYRLWCPSFYGYKNQTE
jgi:uncharacterized SAM-dependent methyltransferase